MGCCRRPVTPAAEPGAGGGIPSEGTEVGWIYVAALRRSTGGFSPGLAGDSATAPRSRPNPLLLVCCSGACRDPGAGHAVTQRGVVVDRAQPLADARRCSWAQRSDQAIRSVTHRYHTPMSGPRSIQPALPGFFGKAARFSPMSAAASSSPVAA